jgi:UDP-N-acetylmuramate: L-alanyl-gamma-D-glutamyl-meso-diaminopimelate ligase
MKQQHIHLLGICGTAMASLAGLLQQMGHKVTGSDENVYPPMSTQLETLKIPVKIGYRAENLNPKPDLAIIGNVITAANAEAQEVVKQQIPYMSLPQALGEFVIGSRESLVVAGTHGKTTSTSLLSWVAQTCQFNPGFLIGGIAKNFSKSFELGRPPYFVIEGDEYDTAYFDKVPKFVHYKPKHVILTSVEFDHADIYADLDAVKVAFKKLLGLIPADGTLVFQAEEKNIWDILESEKVSGSKDGTQPLKHPRGYKILPFSLNAAYSQAVNVVGSPTGTEFDVTIGGKTLGHFSSKMMGDFNVKNALGVITLANSLGWPHQAVKDGIKSFEGVKRRQEILGEPRGVLVIEDFAHHPTAVAGTIAAVRQRYPGRRVFAVFEPRSATSRRNVFQEDYVQALKDADFVLIPPAFNQEKIPVENRFSVEKLVQDLKTNGAQSYLLPDVDRIVGQLAESVKPSDIVLIMSNGGFGGIYQKLLTQLG